jgi:hypothetical protein
MKKVCVYESISAGLVELVRDKAIGLEIVTADADLRIEDSGTERLESDMDVLYSGGWVSCAVARDLAGKLEISLAQMGDMLDHLNVKVRQCGLGCF